MKRIILIALTIPSIAFSGLNSTCSKYINSKANAFKITKNVNAKNVLHFSAAINESDCSFNTSAKIPVNAYWIMGEEKKSNGDTSCEGMTKKEIKKMLGFKDQANMDARIARVIDSGTIELNIPNLPELGEKMGGNTTFSSIVTLKTSTEGGACKVVASGVKNSRDIDFDQIDFKVSMFSLKKVKIFKDGKEL